MGEPAIDSTDNELDGPDSDSQELNLEYRLTEENLDEADVRDCGYSTNR